MPTFIRYNFEDLFKLSSSLQSILVALPDLKKEVLRSIAARYRSQIQGQMLTQGIKYTGTYEQSIKIEFRGSREEPTIALVMRPQGIGADRLPIYWKVLEFGANASPNVLSAPIINWASTKLGADTLGGIKIANNMRSRGINPHPVLQSIFVLTRPDGEVAGLTGLGRAIAEEELNKAMEGLQNLYVNPVTRQQSVRGAGGRWISQG
jgi:hypothetical protein